MEAKLPHDKQAFQQVVLQFTRVAKHVHAPRNDPRNDLSTAKSATSFNHTRAQSAARLHFENQRQSGNSGNKPRSKIELSRKDEKRRAKEEQTLVNVEQKVSSSSQSSCSLKLFESFYHWAHP